jgi:putative hydrolase of the HAD superfamily
VTPADEDGSGATPEKVKAVVFDYYFTLVDPGITTITTLATMLAAVLPALTVDEFLAARTAFLERNPDVGTSRGGVRFETYAEKWRDYAEPLMNHLGAPSQGEQFVEARYQAHATAPAYADARPTIEDLRRRGVLVGILSDADSAYLLENVALNDFHVDAIVSSEELGRYKPDPATFREICDRLGVRPSDALFVGDSPANDVEGSIRAGLSAIWLNRSVAQWPLAHQRPTGEIRSLSELAELFATRTMPN